MKLKDKIIWGLIGALITTFVFIGSTHKTPETNQHIQKPPVKIGVIASFTGKGASRGESVRQALHLAMKEIKRKKLLDRKIELFYQDVPLDKAGQGPAAFQLLTDIKKVDAVIGPMGSNVVMTVAHMVDDKKIPTIIHAASVRKATQGNEYVFRLWPTADSYARIIFASIKNKGYKKIAALTAQSANTVDLLTSLEEKINADDKIKIVADEKTTTEETDFRVQLTKIAQTDPDAIFLNLFVKQFGQAAKQIRELNIKKPLFSNSTFSSIELEIAPKSLEGIWYPRFAGYTDNGKKKFLDEFGSEPANPESAAAAYDALLILARAINEVGTDGESIKNYIYKNNFNGMIGQIKFFSKWRC